MTPQEFLEAKPTKVVLYPDPILLNKCSKIEDINPWVPIAIMMFDIMKANHGCGLAAPQVGLPYTMFVLCVTKPLIVINPEIIEIGDRVSEASEGCLSIPGERINVTRPRKIKAKWTNEEGKSVMSTFEGWTSRAFQHEYDHLLGILINHSDRK